MLVGEVLALIGLIFGGTIGLRAVFAWSQRLAERDKERRGRTVLMLNDLRTALGSRDYRQIDDFIMMWGIEVDPSALICIKHRRDELYIESNP